MQSFVYPAELAPDEKDGGFVVTFVDFPEAITQGEEVAEALCEAADCLEEAVANRMAMELPLPTASKVKKGQYAIPVPALTAAKAALYLAVRDACITKVELAKCLQCDEKEVRRLLDIRHPSKLTRLESALAALGRQLIVGVQQAPCSSP
jgi:antitoxin HicB